MKTRASVVVISLVLGVMLILLIGCGGGGGGTVTPTVTPTTPAQSETFTGYLYAPANRADSTNGLCVLQCSTPPTGYQPVTNAVIYPETNPSQTISPDSSGTFTFTFGKKDRENGSARLIINPQGDFSSLSPIRHLVFPSVDETDVKKLILFPNARKVEVGQAIQLYARAVTSKGRTVFIPPTRVTWHVDNPNMGTISADGVFIAKSAGVTGVTVSMGDLSCTGKVFVISNPATYNYSGVVKDSNGNPVENAVVMVMGTDVVAVTNSDGIFTLYNLPGGTELSILVCYLGQVRYQGVIYLTRDLNLDITIQGDAIVSGTVQGVVRDVNGQGLRGVLVSADDWSTVTDADGSYSIPGIPAGTRLFNFDLQGYTPVTVYREITPGQVSTLDVVMYQVSDTTTGIINGRVVDSSGNGIDGALVIYTAKGPTRAEVTTDASGFFSLINVPAGDYSVNASKTGYFGGTADVTVTAGQAIQARIQLSSYQAPQVDSIDPTSATVGQNITINGTNFGAAQGDSFVTVGGIKVPIVTWSDTSVVCNLPSENADGDVVITREGVYPSNGIDFKMIVKLATGLDKPFDVEVDDDYVYWSEEAGIISGGGYVKRVAKSGGNVEILARRIGFPVSICLDDTYVYWTDSVLGEVSRAPKSGGAIEVLYSGLTGPFGIQVDGSNVFWSQTSGYIRKAPKDGGGPVTDLATGQVAPTCISIDEINVYFSCNGSAPLYQDGYVAMVSKAGGAVNVLAVNQLLPRKNVVDDVNFYWTEVGNGTDHVSFVPKGGGSVTNLVGDDQPKYSIDIDASKVYWIENRTGEIKCINKTGGDVAVIAIDPQTPNEIAVDQNYVFWTNYNNPEGDVLHRMRK